MNIKFELKKCPFCGGEAQMIVAQADIKLYGIECKKCHILMGHTVNHSTEFFSKPIYAADAWNQRAETAANQCEVDCISRFEVTEIINAEWDKDSMLDRVDALPSVTPQEPRKGHWIRVAGGSLIDDYRCDCCNHQPPSREVGLTWGWNFTDYCPNCGAKMVSEDKE